MSWGACAFSVSPMSLRSRKVERINNSLSPITHGCKYMLRSFCFLCVSFAVQAALYAQIESPEQLRERAETQIAAFVADREFAFNQFAVCGRGTFDGVYLDDLVSTTVIMSSCEDSKNDYRAFNMSMKSRDGRSIQGEQSIVDSEEKFFRLGYATKRDWFYFDSPKHEKSRKAVFSNRTLPNYDVYFSGITTVNDLFWGTCTTSLGTERFLVNGELIGAKLTREGNLRGTWKMPGRMASYVDVTFSKRFPSRPERISARIAKAGSRYENYFEGRVFQDARMEWARCSVRIEGETKSRDVILPIAVDSIMYDQNSQPNRLYDMRYRWYLCHDSESFPRVDTQILAESVKLHDWRDPLRELFEEEWKAEPDIAIEAYTDEETPKIFGPILTVANGG